MPELIPRVVFDCNLFVQGIANRNSPAREALRLFFNGDISLFVSEPITREVRDVLNRAEVRRQLPGIRLTIVQSSWLSLSFVAAAKRASRRVRGSLKSLKRSRPP